MKVKYAIFQTNDNGRRFGNAVAVGEAEEREDWWDTRNEAVRDGLSKIQDCAPEDVKDAGWHTAVELEPYLEARKEELAKMQAEVWFLGSR